MGRVMVLLARVFSDGFIMTYIKKCFGILERKMGSGFWGNLEKSGDFGVFSVDGCVV